MEELKVYAIKQIDREIKELESQVFKNLNLLEKLKNNNLIGCPKTPLEIKKEIKNYENRIDYLAILKAEIKNNR